MLLDDRPQALRKQILQSLHSAHQGCTGMKARANQCFYLPSAVGTERGEAGGMCPHISGKWLKKIMLLEKFSLSCPPRYNFLPTVEWPGMSKSSYKANWRTCIINAPSQQREPLILFPPLQWPFSTSMWGLLQCSRT